MSEFARLAGVGPKRAKALEASGFRTLRDLVYHIPRRYVDRTRITPIASLRDGAEAFFTARIEDVEEPRGRLVVRVSDGSGEIDLVFFRGQSYLKPRLKPGIRLAVAGTASLFRNLQIAHPEWEELAEGETPRGGLLPVYPLTEAMEEARLDHRLLQKLALQVLDEYAFTDPLAAEERTVFELRPEKEALRDLHAPSVLAEVESARGELKIRELWPLCLAQEKTKRNRQGKGKAFPAMAEAEAVVRSALGFSMTRGQELALGQITSALEGPAQFFGLLQGDVGSGKTAVALLASVRVLAAGSQAAWLCPTEILAEQHHRHVSAWLEKAGTATALLTSSTSIAERAGILIGLKSGRIGCVIGTHSLLSPEISFRDLRFIVVDEQHRFGVEQRAAMTAKGVEPHVLFLSATPIPRTLAQSWYGDMDLVTLEEKPPGRLPVKTRMIPAEKETGMLAFLRKETGSGNQVYWVVPRIDANSGDGGDAAVETASGRLRKYDAQWRVAQVTGRSSAEEREGALGAFRQGKVDVLVATTVIEVGVDIPGANLMVVQGADRFGLAQLHQLRGRTGRGREQAWCFLLQPAGGWLEDVNSRLREFAATEDGFKIAEMDLRNRGAGDLTGTLQSGFGALRFTDLINDFELVQELRHRAAAVAGG